MKHGPCPLTFIRKDERRCKSRAETLGIVPEYPSPCGPVVALWEGEGGSGSFALTYQVEKETELGVHVDSGGSEGQKCSFESVG